MGDTLTFCDLNVGQSDLHSCMLIDYVVTTLQQKQLDYLLLEDLCLTSTQLQLFILKMAAVTLKDTPPLSFKGSMTPRIKRPLNRSLYAIYAKTPF